ncbi:MAG: VOC family protein [Candidatus Binatia bacterium]
MSKPNDLHHLAISTANIKAQIEFFSDVLGMELVALYWMHGADRCFHAFMKLHDTAYVAFVQTPDNHAISTTIGVTHASNPAASSAPGRCSTWRSTSTPKAICALRGRIRSRSIQVLSPIDHSACQSMYFAGPENLTLEIATSAAAFDPRAWIDPEVVALAGISADELARYVDPPAHADRGSAVAQPPHDASKPNMSAPARIRALLSLPDEQVAQLMSQPEPPVRVAPARFPRRAGRAADRSPRPRPRGPA